jgi:hypothetical protein
MDFLISPNIPEGFAVQVYQKSGKTVFQPLRDWGEAVGAYRRPDGTFAGHERLSVDYRIKPQDFNGTIQ